jgi:hypothetical protein
MCLALVLALAGANVAFGEVIERRVSAGSDDAEEAVNTGAQDTYNTSSDLELIDDTSDNGGRQFVGMTFRNIGISRGARVKRAYVEFACDATKFGSGDAYLLIWGHLTPNPDGFAAPLTPTAISSRPRTKAEVPWQPEPWTAAGQISQTSDITSILQELINQPGWASGNAIEIIIGEDTSKGPFTGFRNAESYNGTASLAPLLHIELSSKYATHPDPPDGVLHLDTWVSLTWEPGETAVTHDVYMSDNRDDVTNGAAAAFQGNQALASNFFFAGLGMPGDPYPNGLTPGTTYCWRIDEVEADGTTKHQGPVWSFSTPSRKAYSPFPSNRGKYIPTDVKLTWTAGSGAKLHTVYFGTKFEDVNNATTGGIRQAPATYTPPGPLAKGTTYYWRVDEFDVLNTYKGDVWSFTTMPDITITNPDLVGWWKFDEGFGSKAIDFSGHGNDGTLAGTTRWTEGIMEGAVDLRGGYVVIDGVDNDVTSTNMTLSIWIKTTQTGSKGLLFALNDSGGSYALQFGVEGGNVYRWEGAGEQYPPAINDDQWHMLTYVRNGSTAYIYVDGVQRVTQSSTFTLDSVTLWSIGQEWDPPNASDLYIGLVDDARIYNKALTADEIKQLMRGDPLLAWKPNPDNRSTVDVEKAKQGLTWSAGDNATQHDVYFGTDQAAVASANASDTTGVYRGRRALASYTPTEVLAWGTGPYYWRIDEVRANGTISTGAVWSFSVANYLVVDDFESYNDLNPGTAGINRIYDTWKDGYGTPTNGALVGYDPPQPSIAETRRAYVHSGSQAMPVLYNNNPPKSSQATRTLTAGRDWTREGVANLSLWFRGDAANAAERMYVSIDGKAPVYHTNANAAQATSYTEWVIPLSTFTAQGVNLANVTSVTIGFGTPGNTTVAGGTGTAYIDDIRLYRP